MTQISTTETSADSTPKIVKNVKSSAQKFTFCFLWFLKISLLILCMIVIFDLGKSLYKGFTTIQEKELTFDGIFALFLLIMGLSCAISVAVAIFFEHQCTLLMILAGLVVYLGMEIYPVIANKDGSWHKLLRGSDNQHFIAFCVLTGLFMLYLIILYFVR